MLLMTPYHCNIGLPLIKILLLSLLYDFYGLIIAKITLLRKGATI